MSERKHWTARAIIHQECKRMLADPSLKPKERIAVMQLMADASNRKGYKRKAGVVPTTTFTPVSNLQRLAANLDEGSELEQ